jgi:hypothetical protein
MDPERDEGLVRDSGRELDVLGISNSRACIAIITYSE